MTIITGKLAPEGFSATAMIYIDPNDGAATAEIWANIAGTTDIFPVCRISAGSIAEVSALSDYIAHGIRQGALPFPQAAGVKQH